MDRAAFEKWAVNVVGNAPANFAGKDCNGLWMYDDELMETHWRCWKAALSTEPDKDGPMPCEHDWKHTGGCQCWNESTSRERGYFCSRPVHECAKCGACDYGENADADRQCEHCSGRKQ